MKWNKLKPPEPDDQMCCCECDVCQSGSCCDFEDVDEAFQRWLKGKPPKNESQSPVLGGITDNLEISMVPALVLLPLLLPLLLRIAALHILLGFTVLTALPVLVLWYYYATHRKRRRTLFFLTLALYSLAYMYYLFITEILPRGGVSQLQFFTVTSGMFLTIVSLISTKRGPGLVATTQQDAPMRSQQDANGSTRQTSGQETVKNKWNRCLICKIIQPPRAGHCRTCGTCIQRLDHHCIWINSCVGRANHRSFLLTLTIFMVTSLYGISLVLASLCPNQNQLFALFYCPGVYSQSSTALCFTCAWFSTIVTCSLLYLLLAQVLNISFNVTEREAQKALRNKTGQSRFFGLLVDTGGYSHGFFKNWVEFLTMGEEPTFHPTQADVV